jgi:hypothetical protein
MAKKGYLPGPDQAYRAWRANLNAAVNNIGLAVLGVSTSENAELVSGFSAFEDALAEHVTRSAEAEAARATKSQLRDEDEEFVRQIVKKIQANPAVTDAMREQLQITVAKPRTPVQKPTQRPAGEVEDIEGLTQTLRVVNTETGKRAKPEGVAALEMRLKVVGHGETAPTDVEQLDFAGVSTTTKIVREFDGADQCKTAYWAFRYLNTRGEAGPWSAITPATIAA